MSFSPVSRKIREVRLRRIQGQIGEVAYQITRVHFANFQAPNVCWRPAVNVFECNGCVRICLELAGVRPEDVELQLAPGRLYVSGHRGAPEPAAEHPYEHAAPMRVVSLEIDHGPFAREIPLPMDLDLERAQTEWLSGLLWVVVPRRAHA